jgi:hypothetical protein
MRVHDLTGKYLRLLREHLTRVHPRDTGGVLRNHYENQDLGC